MVSAYQNPSSQSTADSLSVSSHGMERNALGQAYAKMAECALCHWLGLSFDKLKWGTGYADGGSDIAWHHLTFDVKHTKYRHGKLIWPYRKASLFDKKQFDILVSVRRENPFELAGWVWKDEFKRWCWVATGNSSFAVGTMVWEAPLRSIYELSDMVGSWA